MPRWKTLPDELDPQVKEFAQQLRRLVDGGGLSVSAVADRTGYSKTSWERYLNGRLLAPKGAVIALAEVTGAGPARLTALWELAERAWSRSEMRQDMVTEAIRISRPRTVPEEPGTAPAAEGRGAAAPPGAAGPAGGAPTLPSQSAPAKTPDTDDGARTPRGGSPGVARGPAGARDSARAGGRSAAGPGAPSASPEAFAGTPGTSGPPGPATAGTPSRAGLADDGGASDRARRKRRLTMFLAGVAGALVVIAAAFFLTGGDGKKAESAPKPSATAPSPDPDLPPGVKCSGANCTGKDPEHMGCGGTLAKSTTSVTVGTTLVEVRYSKTCGAAWARVTRAVQGDTVEVSAGGAARQTGSVTAAGDTDAYTPMVAVKDAAAAKACATLTSGQKGCTK